MPQYLKGNYPLSKEKTEPEVPPDQTPTQEFERRALERLGGSIAFVKKDAFVWSGGEAAEQKSSGKAEG